MDSKSFVAVCFSDMAGQVRGQGVPRTAIDELYQRGLPWPADLAALTAFGDAVDTPWDCSGGLQLLPDASSEVTIDFGDAARSESFVLGCLQTTDHTAWAGCTRSFLQACLDALKEEYNLDVSCNYEHQFTLYGHDSTGTSAMSLSALRRERQFAIALSTVLENTGIRLERFGAGVGDQQFTATTRAKFGVAAADGAVIFRQLAHATAEQLGQTCSFAPVSPRGATLNGLMLGLDLFDEGDRVSHDPAGPNGVSAILGSFIAGIERHLPALTALTRPALLTAANASGDPGGAHAMPWRDSPVIVNPLLRTADKREYSVAFTAADATACPYLQLGALVSAGLQGLREALPTPDLGTTAAAPANGSNGNGAARSNLPGDLAAALSALAKDEALRKNFPDGLLDVYASVKQAELAAEARMSPDELAAWLQQIY